MIMVHNLLEGGGTHIAAVTRHVSPGLAGFVTLR